MERQFAQRYATTGDRSYAAANYGQPSSAATKLLANPDVQNEIRRKARHKLQTEGAEIGVEVLITIAKDKLQPGGTRVRAAEALVKHSGISGVDTLDEEDLAGMKPGELDALLDKARRELALRAQGAKTIEHAPAIVIEQPAEQGVFD